MHELAVTEDLIKTASRYAENAKALRISQVNLVIGEMAGYVDESIQFYWDILAEETLCRGARLHIEKVEAHFSCLHCGSEFALAAELAFCPHCRSHEAKLLRGNEFYLHSIDIETE